MSAQCRSPGLLRRSRLFSPRLPDRLAQKGLFSLQEVLQTRYSLWTGSRGELMLKILIVEDDELLARTLQHLVELNPLHSVTAIADNYLSSIEAVARQGRWTSNAVDQHGTTVGF